LHTKADMYIKISLLISFLALINSNLFVYSQQEATRATISGTIKNSADGESLFGVQLIVQNIPNTGTRTNEYGFFSLTLPTGEYTIQVRSVGYESQLIELSLKENKRLNIELVPLDNINQLDEIEVTAFKENDNITKSGMAVTTLNIKEIELIPVLFGERDVLKTLQLTPGVKSAGEGMSGFYVRGGSADQNLVLIDEAPVYNASHLLGFFSIFNSDAIKDVSLHKAGIPAEYGGRASSVLDVRMKEGNSKQYIATGGIGLISSRLAIEGPIIKDKGSFIVAGRRTYLDLFLLFSNDSDTRQSKAYFYDLNIKANYQLSEKNRIYLSGYFGRDNFGFSNDFGFSWGNKTSTVRWNSIISEKLFSNTSLIFSTFDYSFNIGDANDEDFNFGLKAGLVDWNIKQDFNYYPNQRNSVKFGGNMIYHTFSPGKLTSSIEAFNEQVLDDQYALEMGLYVQNDYKLSDRISVLYGVRYSGFNYMGKGTAYRFDEVGEKIGEQKYKQGESIQYHQFLEPRISAAYLLSERNSIKIAYNRNSQFLHQLSNSTTSSPTDIWVPSTNNVKPQLADQITAGYYQNFRQNKYALTTEIYYKHLSNQIDYRNGASLFLNAELEGDLVYGKGRAYGLEVQIEKKKGDLTGWISYTLARSRRTFEQINMGREFSSRQDRIHDIAVVAMYQKNESKFAFSASYVYYTGDAVTFPSGKYKINNEIIPYYTERNGYRMPHYHRLDIGVTRYLKDNKRFTQSLNFSVYNVYGRQNAFIIFFEGDPDVPGKTKVMQLSVFRFVPSFTYNFTIK